MTISEVVQYANKRRTTQLKKSVVKTEGDAFDTV